MPKSSEKAALFIDRDGTLNEMVYDQTHGLLDSPKTPEQVILRPGAAELINAAHELGFLVVVVTNQPGIAKGTLSEKNLELVNARLSELLRVKGAQWDDLRYCPHHPDFGGLCKCRKPEPGLLLDAAKDLGISFEKSWMVGDGINDIQAGKRAGCKTILVTSLKIEQVERFFSLSDAEPDKIYKSLSEVMAVI